MSAPPQPLRPYQESAIVGVYNEWQSGRRSVCLVAPTGAGKTRLGEEFVWRARQGGERVLWIAHRRELIVQAVKRLRLRFGDLAVGIISPDFDPLPGAPIQVATVQTWLARERRPEASFIVFDECFPAGTLIDGRPIEDIRRGEFVDAYDHRSKRIVRREVKSLFCRRPSSLIRVSFISGKQIVCTPNHPFFTTRGYVPAEELTREDVCSLRAPLAARHEGAATRDMQSRMPRQGHPAPQAHEDRCALLDVRGGVLPDSQHSDDRVSANEPGVLLGRVRERDAQPAPLRDQYEIRISADESAQPDVRPCNKGEGFSNVVRDWSSPTMAGRSRSGHHGPTASALDGAEDSVGGMGCGVPSENASSPRAPADHLSGPRTPVDADSHRGGRDNPFDAEGSGCRSPQGGVLEQLRVVGVEVLEPGSDGRYGGLCPDGHVYNLEVDEHHNYFAEGVLVHNCHHFVSDDWRALAEHYRIARALGLTATPERSDGRPLGDIFDALVVAAKYSELLRDGFLVPCLVHHPSKILGSDLAQDPLVAYQRLAAGSRAFVYCGSVDAAKELSRRFRDAGTEARTIAGTTPTAERDRYLADFEAGSVRVLTNVFTLTEGVDIPAAQTAIIARGCSHVGTYLQIAGRVLRPHPEKEHAILIDLVGAALQHGMPTEDRDYALSEKGITRTSLAPMKVCPKCLATILSAYQECPDCGQSFEVDSFGHRTGPQIYDMELRSVFAGAHTPSTAKVREYRRLRELARAKGWNLYFVIKQYKKLFGVAPVIVDATPQEKAEEFARLRKTAASKGFKAGFAAMRFKDLFGHWPERTT